MRIHRPHRGTSLLAVFLVLAATGLFASPAQAIVGGVESSKPYAFLGSLERPESPRPDKHVCGVSVLAPQWVISASHCAAPPNQAAVGTPRGWRVRIGSLSASSGGQVVDVDKFYRLATPRPDGFFGRDLSLLHLRTPVRAVPIRLASATPPDHTPARIVGWGMTCDDRNNPACFPDKLREADTAVQPISACSTGLAGQELCIGSLDGSVAATNMDSGGPALVREKGRWVLAGIVSGGNANQPVLYTDVTKRAAWINGIVDGTAVPREVPVPSLAGTVELDRCMASVVRTPDARPGSKALLLTNGHCVEGARPAVGSALVDQPANRPIAIQDSEGYDKVTATANRLVYATMTGTDIALYRLDKTYAQLAAQGEKVFQVTTKPVGAGAHVDVLSGAYRQPCTVQAVISHLREAGYQQDNSFRWAATDNCYLGPGYSGSAVIASDGNTIVGVHNTSNRDGAQCTDGNPCEVAANGTVTSVQGRTYGQQINAIPACLTAQSTLDLFAPGCVLARPAA
ncbi:trypsin-like serine protease [Fodinicola feengrottensis]|uniref:trypsin-like serine protease n=1 Tax=Fodinicola feengrottensis TaxID=435914 RepID=UPI0013CF7C41|nr:trypsin-like serine protease [Fodinicola feengrottensis]